MTKKELSIILDILRMTKSTIINLDWDAYPEGDPQDKDLKKIFYDLNSMCIVLTDKIDQISQKEAAQ